MPWGVTAADVWTPNATLQARVSARQPWGGEVLFLALLGIGLSTFCGRCVH